MKDWKTTTSAILTAFFGFVLLSPQYFYPVIVDVAEYAAIGGFIAFGINAADHRRSLLDRPWNKDDR